MKKCIFFACLKRLTRNLPWLKLGMVVLGAPIPFLYYKRKEMLIHKMGMENDKLTFFSSLIFLTSLQSTGTDGQVVFIDELK